jgi:hypothetical protein
MDPITHALMMAAAGKGKQPRWVIGGQSGLLMSSDDAETWDTQSSPVSADWAAGIFSSGLGKFVMVGGSGSGSSAGRAVFSGDGEGWSEASVPSSYAPIAVTLGKNVSSVDTLVALYNGGSSRHWTSTDGESWANGSSALPSVNDWTSICPANGLGFLVVRPSATGTDTTARVYVGVTGYSWGGQSAAAQGYWNDICFSADFGLAVAVGDPSLNGNSIMTSNGEANSLTTWTVRTPPSGGNIWTSICAGPGRFVAMSSTHSMVSINGTSWTRYSMPNSASRIWRKVLYGDGKYVALGVNTSTFDTVIAVSSDGQTWDEVASLAGIGLSIAYGEI